MMTMSIKQTIPPNLFRRFWIYQAERFPVFGHGILIAAFSFSAVSFSALLRDAAGWPGAGSILVAFASAFLFFLQLRIADEFKDFEEDARYRAYRPVPRGLVSLRELGLLGALTALVQLGLALWLEPALVWLLLLVWGYMALMSREFFVRAWLKAHPVTYLWSHMLIVPLIDLYATACDWRVAGDAAPHGGLVWFLIVSFFNGVVIEIGRKVRAPRDEEPGVETYSALWGRRNSMMVWLGAMLLTAVSAWLAARQIDFALPVVVLLVSLLFAATVIAVRFLQKPVPGRARFIEPMSGLWTLLMYLSVGAIPMVHKLVS
jgi:4-hydroxybenzoate polyprenyltransferase